MRVAPLLPALFAALALPAPALAHDLALAAKATAKPAVKKPAAKKPAAKPAPEMDGECCKPEPVAAKPAAPKAEAACCAPGQPKCADCAAAEAAKAQPKADAPCCDHPKADGSCCSPDKPHGMPEPGMRREVRIERRFERGGRWGRHPMMMKGDRIKSSEVRYMPAMAGGSQHIVLGRGGSLQVNPWLSLGHQMNWSLQLGNGPNAGPWFTPYGGFLPRVGAQLGPIRGDLGALIGLGGMFRTGQVMGATGPVNDVLQARIMWVLEPRVELGWRGEHLGVGLVGAYNFNPNMADFGGPSVGLKMTWKRPGWM